MSAIATSLKNAVHSLSGVTWQDKKLAFLLASIGMMGEHRKELRNRFIHKINSSALDGRVHLRLRANRRALTLAMRDKNLADYLVVGELIRGSYPVPGFRPKSIIDGGANIGTFTLHAYAHFPDAEVTCYEPDEDNFDVLKTNLADNGIRADLRQKATWSESGTLSFHEGESHMGYADTGDGGNPIECELPEIGPDCWLKLDVEGAEYEVLPALFASGNYPRAISMEIHFLNKRGRVLLDLLDENGYEYFEEGNPDYGCINVTAERPGASTAASEDSD